MVLITRGTTKLRRCWSTGSWRPWAQAPTRRPRHSNDLPPTYGDIGDTDIWRARE